MFYQPKTDPKSLIFFDRRKFRVSEPRIMKAPIRESEIFQMGWQRPDVEGLDYGRFYPTTDSWDERYIYLHENHKNQRKM